MPPAGPSELVGLRSNQPSLLLVPKHSLTRICYQVHKLEDSIIHSLFEDIKTSVKDAKHKFLFKSISETEKLATSLQDTTNIEDIEQHFITYLTKLNEGLDNFREVKSAIEAFAEKTTQSYNEAVQQQDRSSKDEEMSASLLYDKKLENLAKAGPKSVATKKFMKLDKEFQKPAAKKLHGESDSKRSLKNTQLRNSNDTKAVVAEANQSDEPGVMVKSAEKEAKPIQYFPTEATAIIAEGSKVSLEGYLPANTSTLKPVPTGVDEKSENLVTETVAKVKKETLEDCIQKKATKTQTIGNKGGEIKLYSCEVAFPRDALKEETEFKVSIDSNPENFPKKGTTITPILGVSPSMQFHKPVRVKLWKWYRPPPGEKIHAQILCKEEGCDWELDEENKSILLTDEKEISFEVNHFCNKVGVTAEGEKGNYAFINDVYMQRGTAVIKSIFCKDPLTQDNIFRVMKAEDYARVTAPSEKFEAKLGTTFEVDVEVVQPEDVTYTGLESPFTITITEDFVKKEHVRRSFTPRKFPLKCPEPIPFIAKYFVKLLDSKSKVAEEKNTGIMALLSKEWPLPKYETHDIPPPAVPVQNLNLSVNNSKNTDIAQNMAKDGGQIENKYQDTVNPLAANM